MVTYKYIVFSGGVPGYETLGKSVAKYIASVVEECSHHVEVFGKVRFLTSERMSIRSLEVFGEVRFLTSERMSIRSLEVFGEVRFLTSERMSIRTL